MAQDLKIAYRVYNELYFRGQLPEVPVKWSKRLERVENGCYVVEPAPGEIQIDPKLKRLEKFWKMILLHEMCHVKVRSNAEEKALYLSPDGKHSAAWLREMRRLARIGAFDEIW